MGRGGQPHWGRGQGCQGLRLSGQETAQHCHGDLRADRPHEYHQSSHQLHHWRGEVQPYIHHQHHLHDGPDLHLPLGLGQPAHDLGHQAYRGLAVIQPRLPLPRYSCQRLSPGTVDQVTIDNELLGLLIGIWPCCLTGNLSSFVFQKCLEDETKTRRTGIQPFSKRSINMNIEEDNTKNGLCRFLYLTALYFNPLLYVVFVILYVVIYFYLN